LAKHWPNVRRWGDIRTFPPDTNATGLAERKSERSNDEPQQSPSKRGSSEWAVDLICGGFPCQDISYAGRGAGLEGERSGLFFEAIRVVRQLRPRYVLLENVAALLTRGLDRVHGELAQIGYCSESHCIPAAAVGAPHIRDRVFVIGTRNADTESERCGKGWTGRTSGTGEGEEDSAEVANANEPIASERRLQRGGQLLRTRGDTQADIGRESASPWSTQCRLGIHPDGLSSGLDGCGGWECGIPRVAKGQRNRVSRLRGLGNAVVPQVAEFIGRQIIRASLSDV